MIRECASVRSLVSARRRRAWASRLTWRVGPGALPPGLDFPRGVVVVGFSLAPANATYAGSSRWSAVIIAFRLCSGASKPSCYTRARTPLYTHSETVASRESGGGPLRPRPLPGECEGSGADFVRGTLTAEFLAAEDDAGIEPQRFRPGRRETGLQVAD
jgi:hypothetical protein